jgi:hypothetical protein
MRAVVCYCTVQQSTLQYILSHAGKTSEHHHLTTPESSQSLLQPLQEKCKRIIGTPQNGVKALIFEHDTSSERVRCHSLEPVDSPIKDCEGRFLLPLTLKQSRNTLCATLMK